MRFFLKSIDVWSIVESEWTPPNTSIGEWTVLKKQTRVVNDRAMNAICIGSMGDSRNYI
jgi:carbonic anhydrase